MMKPRVNFQPLSWAAIALLFAVAGCGHNDIQVYQVATNDLATTSTPQAAMPGAMPSSMPAGLPAPDHSLQPKLKYTLPDGWKEKAATQMRVASFDIAEGGKTADVSVIPLGGMAGGDAANVNRWRGQVGLAALDEASLAKLAEKIEIAGTPAELYDLNGTAPGSGDAQRILAVIFHREDTVWFFKVTGDSALVEKQKPAFIAFLKSVQFSAEAAAAPKSMDMSQLPPSHPAIGGDMSSMGNMGGAPGADATASPAEKPTWKVPAGWQEGPLAMFLVGKFIVTGAGDAKAEVNVSQLAGEGGGLLANINRWCNQIGAKSLTEADLAKLPTLSATGSQGTVVDISGTNPRTGKAAQLVGVILPLGGQTWFYKLMGDAAVVTAQKAALLDFVQSAKYPDAH
jgi:hypothetical protein